MTTNLDALGAALQDALGDRIRTQATALGEVTIEIRGDRQVDVCERLRDDPRLGFDTLIDLCVVDYQRYGEGGEQSLDGEALRLAQAERRYSIMTQHYPRGEPDRIDARAEA